jgi:small GTP-binding protein
MEFATQKFDFEKCVIKAQIWDTAGQERFESMTKAYFRDAVGAALVYDVTSMQSFLNAKQTWMKQVKEYGCENMKIVLGKSLSLSLSLYGALIRVALRTTSMSELVC